MSAVEGLLIPIIQPILSPLWVGLAVGEWPGRWALADGAFVVAAVTWRGLTPTGARA